MDGERWTPEDYVVWILILIGVLGIGWVAYRLVIALGEAIIG